MAFKIITSNNTFCSRVLASLTLSSIAILTKISFRIQKFSVYTSQTNILRTTSFTVFVTAFYTFSGRVLASGTFIIVTLYALILIV